MTERLETAIQRVGNAVDLLRNMPGRAYSHGVVDAQFTNWQSEAQAWRKACAFLDQSHHMIDLYVKGPGAHALLTSIGVNSFASFRPGMAKQFVVVSPDGLYVGDCVLFYLEENLFNLVGRRTVLDWVEFNNHFTFYCMTWMPAYLVEQRGLSLERSGLYTFFSFAGIACVALGSGWVADRLFQRGGNAVYIRKAFTVAGFLGACTIVLGAHANSVSMALFWNVFSLSFIGLTTANNLALCRLTLVPAPVVGLVTGVQQVATSLAGIVAPILSGWLLQVTGSYAAPMQVIFVFLLIGALATVCLLRPELAPRLREPVILSAAGCWVVNTRTNTRGALT